MNEREIFEKTFSNLHASNRTLQEVLNRVHTGKGAKGISKRFAVLVAAVIAVFSMAVVAYAADLPGRLIAILTPAENPGQMIDQAFGDSISTEKPEREDAYGNPLEAPSMERPAVDLTETEKLIGAYISDVDGVLTVGSNTFTLKNFMIDERGSGAITWTLENPNGITYGDAGYGIVYFNSWTIDNPMLHHFAADGSKKKATDMYTALISKNESGTRLELVSYFGTFDFYEIGDIFVWSVSTGRKQDIENIQLTPVEHIPTKTMSTKDGMKLAIAHQSLTIDVYQDQSFVTDRVVIHYKDGTQYCVEDDAAKIYNIAAAFWRDNEAYRYGELVYLFNRIIDPEQVAYVEVESHWLEHKYSGEEVEYIKHTQTYVFYP